MKTCGLNYYGYASLVAMTNNANTLLIIALLLNNGNILPIISWVTSCLLWRSMRQSIVEASVPQFSVLEVNKIGCCILWS
jgi:hypothetical protein